MGLTLKKPSPRGTPAPSAAQVQAEPVAQEPVAWRVYSMMLQGAPNNVKARGIGSDPTEYLYPAHREADARECARLMRGEVQPLYAHHDTHTPPAPDDLDALVAALHNGKQADMDGCMVKVSRQACEEAAAAITALRARPATVQVKPLVWKKGTFSGQPMLFADTEFGSWLVVAFTGRDGRWAYDDPTGEISAEDWGDRGGSASGC
jgi:hypothetical protein